MQNVGSLASYVLKRFIEKSDHQTLKDWGSKYLVSMLLKFLERFVQRALMWWDWPWSLNKVHIGDGIDEPSIFRVEDHFVLWTQEVVWEPHLESVGVIDLIQLFIIESQTKGFDVSFEMLYFSAPDNRIHVRAPLPCQLSILLGNCGSHTYASHKPMQRL